MSQADHHSHTNRSLGITIGLNVVITAAQIAGGLISGSLALISDAIHNLSDGVAVFLAYLASVISQKERTAQSTFGYKRAEILAAFINALVLIAISFYLMIEAVKRFFQPQEVDFKWMLILGFLGLIANSFSVLILYKDQHNNLNVKAAYLHLMGDALTSLAVIAGAFFIWLWNWYWIDPAVTLLISFYLLFHTIRLLKESTGILMQFAPASIHIKELEIRINGIEGITRVYHIHIWRLTDHTIHFEAHVELADDLRLSQTQPIIEQVTDLLKKEYEITHITLQFEFDSRLRDDCGMKC
ncbi:MAG: cation diffusion facilitator family transporter [Mangrovibacterium sp.]